MRTLMLAALLAPSSALAVDMFDAEGYEWDIQEVDYGDFQNGTSDAFDNWGNLCVLADTNSIDPCDPSEKYTTNGATAAPVGDFLDLPVFIHPSGLEISRSYYVPSSGADGFVRIAEILTNPTASDLTVKVRFGNVDSSYSDFGSDSSTQYTGSSNGNTHASGTVFTEDATWITSDDSSTTSGDPSLGHILGDGTIPVTAGNNLSWQGTDEFYVEWVVTVPAGETAIIAHFETQQPSDADAISTSEALVASPDLTGLSSAQIAAIANWGGTAQPTPFVVNTPANPVAPGSNTFIITGATPGGTVYFVVNPTPGAFTPPPCPGITLDGNNPRLLGSQVIGPVGVAAFTVNVPPVAAGQTPTFQAVEVPGCNVTTAAPVAFP